MRRPPGRLQSDPEHAARRDPEAVVGRLSVDEKAAVVGGEIRRAGSVAAPFFPDDEQQPHASLATAAKDVGGRHLRGEDALRIAGTAAADPIALETARKERRHAIEMRGQHDGGFARRGEEVESGIVHPLLGDGEAETAQVLREPAPGLGLAAGRRVDVDQRARQTDEVNVSRTSSASRASRAFGRYRIHASSSVRVSVRESRYLTMTGVESDRPQFLPCPTLTARAPGTTTAPSGTTRGLPSAGLMISPRTRSYTGVDPVRTVPAAIT